jgi:hypothetical protein
MFDRLEMSRKMASALPWLRLPKTVEGQNWDQTSNLGKDPNRLSRVADDRANLICLKF